MKKLVFCFILLNAVNVCAHLHPYPYQGKNHTEKNGHSLKEKIIQKWDQITSDLLRISNSEANNIKNKEFNYAQDNTRILMDAFLRECN